MISSSSTSLALSDYKGQSYLDVDGTQMLAMDLSNNSHYAYGDLNNSSKTTKEHIVDAQDGRWEGGNNGCGIMLDSLQKSQGSSTRIGNITLEHFGLMCTDDEKTEVGPITVMIVFSLVFYPELPMGMALEVITPVLGSGLVMVEMMYMKVPMLNFLHHRALEFLFGSIEIFY